MSYPFSIYPYLTAFEVRCCVILEHAPTKFASMFVHESSEEVFNKVKFKMFLQSYYKMTSILEEHCTFWEGRMAGGFVNYGGI